MIASTGLVLASWRVDRKQGRSMAYKTILVHLSEEHRVMRALATAVSLARDMDARLIGLAVTPPILVVPTVVTMGTVSVIEEHRSAYASNLPALKKSFETAAAAAGIRSEWRECDAASGEVVEVVIAHGRSVELIVTPQADPAWTGSTMFEQPERLILESGRPVVIVPNAPLTDAGAPLPARHVTIAWNGRREAARAVFDALPLLQAAKHVDVVWIASAPETEATGVEATDEIIRTLTDCGVVCSASRTQARDGDIGAALMRHAVDNNSGLLVMGSYGHSRLYEMVLGGASRHVLANMTVPILMSH